MASERSPITRLILSWLLDVIPGDEESAKVFIAKTCPRVLAQNKPAYQPTTAEIEMARWVVDFVSAAPGCGYRENWELIRKAWAILAEVHDKSALIERTYEIVKTIIELYSAHPEQVAELSGTMWRDLVHCDAAFEGIDEAAISALLQKKYKIYRTLAELCVQCGAMGVPRLPTNTTRKARQAQIERIVGQFRAKHAKARKRMEKQVK